jgi:hypothetical protein
MVVVRMVLKVGDLIAITVPTSWAKAAKAGDVIHHFKGDDTQTSRLYAARLASLGDAEGLWVESMKNESGKSRIRTKLLIPWGYVIALRSDPLSEVEREKLGFAHFEGAKRSRLTVPGTLGSKK